MAFRQRTYVRAGLLCLLLLFAGSTVYFVMRHRPRGVAPQILSDDASAAQLPVMWEGIDFVRTEGDKKVFQVKAAQHYKDTEGFYQLKGGVEIKIFGKGAAEDTAYISADSGHYDGEFMGLFLEGNVRARLESGLKMTGDSLRYLKDKDLIRSSDAVKFDRGDVSGRGNGLTIAVAEKLIEFIHKVEFDIKNVREDMPAMTQIRSRYMHYNDDTKTGIFQDGVEVTNADSFLRAEEIYFALTPDGGKLRSLDARVGVEALFGGAARGAGSLQNEDGRSLSTIASGPGEKRLKADTALLTYTPDGRRLDHAIASGNASMEILRKKDEQVRSKRRIEANTITLGFFADKDGIEKCDAKGGVKVEILQAGKSRKDTLQKNVSCDSLASVFDPLTEEASRMDFVGNVRFSDSESETFGDRGLYEGATKLLVITEGNPRVEREGSTVSGKRIEINEDTGFLRAIGEAKTAFQKKSGEISFFGDAEAPVYLSAATMTYDPSKGVAIFTTDARAWQGDNIITANQITVDQGENTFAASTGVKSVLFTSVPKKGSTAKPGETERVPVTVTSENMLYTEQLRTIAYTTTVVMHREEADMASDRCEVFFKKKVNDIDRMVSTGNITITQPGKRIVGQSAVYDLSLDAVTLTGKPRVIDMMRGTSQGKTLTYYFGDGKIILDGQMEGRTTTIYQPEID